MFCSETPFAQLDARGWAEFNWGCRGSAVRGETPITLSFLSFPRPFPSEETTENDDDVYRSLEELAE